MIVYQNSKRRSLSSGRSLFVVLRHGNGSRLVLPIGGIRGGSKGGSLDGQRVSSRGSRGRQLRAINRFSEASAVPKFPSLGVGIRTRVGNSPLYHTGILLHHFHCYCLGVDLSRELDIKLNSILIFLAHNLILAATLCANGRSRCRCRCGRGRSAATGPLWVETAKAGRFQKFFHFLLKISRRLLLPPGIPGEPIVTFIRLLRIIKLVEFLVNFMLQVGVVIFEPRGKPGRLLLRWFLAAVFLFVVWIWSGHVESVRSCTTEPSVKAFRSKVPMFNHRSRHNAITMERGRKGECGMTDDTAYNIRRGGTRPRYVNCKSEPFFAEELFLL